MPTPEHFKCVILKRLNVRKGKLEGQATLVIHETESGTYWSIREQWGDDTRIAHVYNNRARAMRDWLQWFDTEQEEKE